MKTVSRQRFSLWLFLVILGLLIVVGLLPGCAPYSEHERTYAASYNADERMGTISITLRPVTPTARAIERTANLDERQIAAIFKEAMNQARYPNVLDSPTIGQK